MNAAPQAPSFVRRAVRLSTGKNRTTRSSRKVTAATTATRSGGRGHPENDGTATDKHGVHGPDSVNVAADGNPNAPNFFRKFRSHGVAIAATLLPTCESNPLATRETLARRQQKMLLEPQILYVRYHCHYFPIFSRILSLRGFKKEQPKRTPGGRCMLKAKHPLHCVTSCTGCVGEVCSW